MVEETISLIETLGHKRSEKEKWGIISGTTRTTEYETWSETFHWTGNSVYGFVSTKCPFCGEELDFKILTKRHFKRVRIRWIVALILFSIVLDLAFFPELKQMAIASAAVFAIIVFTILRRRQDPVMTWGDWANRNQKHIILP